MGVGQSLPFTVTGEVSYTPQFEIDPQKSDKQGSINVGVALGIHVPLIDLN